MKVSLGIYEASLCLIPGPSSSVSCFSDFCPLYLRVFCLNGYSSVNKAKSNQISSNEGLNLLFSMRNHKNLTALAHELHFASLFSLHRLLVLTGNPEPWFCSPPDTEPHTLSRRPKKAEAPTLPRPGASFTLLTALSRQGGAGGGEVCRMPLKLVAKRGGSAAEDAEGRCFFFLEDRFNFWAALEGKMQKRNNEAGSREPSEMLGATLFSFS